MSTIELSDAATCLPDLVARVQNGETIALTDGDKHVAMLAPPPHVGYGSLKGKMWMSDDFDEPLDFREPPKTRTAFPTHVRPGFGGLTGAYRMGDDFDDSLEGEFDCLR